jgi:hypothetical protein
MSINTGDLGDNRSFRVSGDPTIRDSVFGLDLDGLLGRGHVDGQ